MEKWAVVKTTEKADLLEFLNEYAHLLSVDDLRHVCDQAAILVDMELVDYERWEEVP